MTSQLESYILLQSIFGVPPACGPLLQLGSAQAGQVISPNRLQQNIGLMLTGQPVVFWQLLILFLALQFSSSSN